MLDTKLKLKLELLKTKIKNISTIHAGECNKDLDGMKALVTNLLGQIHEEKIKFEYQTAILEKEISDLKEQIQGKTG